MTTRIQITGLDETVTALRAFDAQLPDVLQASHREGTQDVGEALGNYPAQPASIAKRPRAYVRTMAYRNTQVTAYTSPLESYVATPDDAAPWVRGDGESYEGAWMHAGIWETITEIVARLQTAIEDIFNRRIEGLIWRLFGS